MSEPYYRLLDGVIGHLKQLKEQGVRYLDVSPATLRALAASPAAPSAGGARSAAGAARRAPAKQSPPPTVAPAAVPAAPLSPPPTLVPSVALPTPAPMAPPPAATPAAAHLPAASEPRSLERPSASPGNDSPPPALRPPAVPQAPGSPPASASTPEEVMGALRAKVLACVRCPHLAQARTQAVFGVGNVRATLMFVGEAPGADEDLQGEPFVGKAGQLLTKIIETMGFTRQTVYIANILKCRPDTPGQTAGNRKPTPAEMQTCLPYLLAQIEAIRPQVIVALGATAVEGLLGKTVGITRLRGHFQTFQGVPVMPTYHPAYLLRNQSLAVKREVWEDMLQVMEKLGCAISAKQRSYFLPKAS